MSDLPPRDELLAIFEAEARLLGPEAAEGRPFVIDGPVMRIEFPSTGMIHAPADLGVDGPALEALIERQVRFFADRGLPVEWKTYAGDRPEALLPLLLAAGFEADPVEAVMVASSATPSAHEVAGVVIRDARPDDFGAIGELLREVWGTDNAALLAELQELRDELGPEGIRILVAEADHRPVSVAWLIMRRGHRFAGLWGGSTHPDHRGRGIYRALVAERARIAAAAGFRYLRVDASEMSRPVLDRLGFVQLTTTTPYVWSP
jgi:GNAT superfamily N-acetyltransferase